MPAQFQYDVFLSYTKRDRTRVRRLAERLRAGGFRVWFDEWVIRAGDDIYLAIERGLQVSRVQILCVSPAALGSNWVTLERNTTLFRDPTNESRRFVPLLLKACSFPDTLGRYKYVDYQNESDTAFKTICAACRGCAFSPNSDPGALRRRGEHELTTSIKAQTNQQSVMRKEHSRKNVGTARAASSLDLNDELLRQLEDTARIAVVVGGVAAMPYYRSSLRANERGDGVNPTTEADVRATVAMVHYLDTEMRKITPRFAIWGEELSEQNDNPSLSEMMWSSLPVRNSIVHTAAEFTKLFKGRVCILIDALDGTRNFDSGMPSFCSAVAIFVDAQLKVGALYDPIHHTVMCGSLGYRDGPRAFEWGVASGERVQLRPNPRDLTVAVHLPSKDEKPREKILELCKRLTTQGEHGPMAKRIYMLNSGQMAMAMVARGQLAAFCNPHTNSWDVAAGEVLVRAVGGRVTDFRDVEIDYNVSPMVQVLAAVNPHFHRTVREAIP